MLAYQVATNAAWVAWQRKDYPAVTNQAGIALRLKPGDRVASNLMAQGQDGIKAAAALEEKYQAATNAAWAAWQRKDYPAVTNQAGIALRLKPGDTVANSLMAQGLDGIKAPATPPPLVNRSPFTNSLGMQFVWLAWVPPKGVYMGKYEVTQKQFRALMGKLPDDSPFVPGDDLPVANVTFKEAKEFCDRVSQREHRTYALPSREEWLAAAGLSEDQVANAWDLVVDRLRNEVTSMGSTSVSQVLTNPAVVGSRGAQTNGLCDLLGNVHEWVIGKTGGESAGFCYRSVAGESKKLFPPLDKPWVQRETGLRCILREGQ
jgi:hypothetical protein